MPITQPPAQGSANVAEIAAQLACLDWLPSARRGHAERSRCRLDHFAGSGSRRRAFRKVPPWQARARHRDTAGLGSDLWRAAACHPVVTRCALDPRYGVPTPRFALEVRRGWGQSSTGPQPSRARWRRGVGSRRAREASPGWLGAPASRPLRDQGRVASAGAAHASRPMPGRPTRETAHSPHGEAP